MIPLTTPVGTPVFWVHHDRDELMPEIIEAPIADASRADTDCPSFQVSWNGCCPPRELFLTRAEAVAEVLRIIVGTLDALKEGIEKTAEYLATGKPMVERAWSTETPLMCPHCGQFQRHVNVVLRSIVVCVQCQKQCAIDWKAGADGRIGYAMIEETQR